MPTLLMVYKSQFFYFWKKFGDYVILVQCPFNKLINKIVSVIPVVAVIIINIIIICFLDLGYIMVCPLFDIDRGCIVCSCAPLSQVNKRKLCVTKGKVKRNILQSVSGLLVCVLLILFIRARGGGVYSTLSWVWMCSLKFQLPPYN